VSAVATAAPERNGLAAAALAFAIAAAVSSWNPLAAPFGLVVGLASLGLAVRALRRPSRRAVALSALVTAVVAVIASAVVLALSAGVGRGLAGAPVVTSPAREDVTAELDAADERTRAARERAQKELEALEPTQATTPGKAGRGRSR
jgi:hypothetical protein